MKKIQNIIGGEKNFLFSDKNFFGVGGIFLERMRVFAMGGDKENISSEDENLNEIENSKNKTEFNRWYYDKIGEKISSDSEETKRILDNNFRTAWQRSLKIDNIDGRIGMYGSEFENKDGVSLDIVTNFGEKFASLKNDAWSKIGVLTEGNTKEYERVAFQEQQIQLTIDNLNEIKTRKINSLEKFKKAMESLKEMRGIMSTAGHGIANGLGKTANFVTAGVGGKLVKHFTKEGNAEKEIKKLNLIEEKLKAKKEKVKNKKEEIEKRFEKKMGNVNKISENVEGILENTNLSKEKIEFFIKKLKKGNIDYSNFSNDLKIKGEIEDIKSKDGLSLKNIIDKINNDEIISMLDKKVLSKSVKRFNNFNSEKYQDYEQVKDDLKFYGEVKKSGKFEQMAKNEERFKKFEKISDSKFKDEEIKDGVLNGEKFHGNYEGKKIKLKNGLEQILFVEKGENLDWDKSSVLIFDKYEGFIEVNDEFLKNKENKEVKKEIEDKVKEIGEWYKNKILSDLSYNKELEDSYKKFLNKFEKNQDEQKILELEDKFKKEKTEILNIIGENDNFLELKGLFKKVLLKGGLDKNINDFKNKIKKYNNGKNSLEEIKKFVNNL